MPDGVSPRSLPGQEGGIFMANSDEHDEFGYTSEDARMRINQVDKRFAKLRGMVGEVPPPKLHGPKTAELTIVGWGSTKGAILTAMKHLKARGHHRELSAARHDLAVPGEGGRPMRSAMPERCCWSRTTDRPARRAGSANRPASKRQTAYSNTTDARFIRKKSCIAPRGLGGKPFI